MQKSVKRAEQKRGRERGEVKIYMYTPIWSNQSISSSGSDVEGGIDEEVLASSREREAVYLDVGCSLE